MKVSSIGSYNSAFKAHLAQNISKDSINLYYGERIKALEDAREPLLELDSFLKSEEVQSAIEQLPKGDEIFVDCRNMDINDTHLLYTPANKSSMDKFNSIPVDNAVTLALLKIGMKDGKTDTKSISDWFSNLVEFLGK